jgi:Family of unknown function (DUF5872)
MAKYTKPELRERLKAEIKASGKGGKKGQWSARKSQLLVRRYEQEGGGYTGKRDKRQRSLARWGDEKWQTKDGSADARGGERRYLPEAAWRLLTKAEREATEQRKRGAKGQFEANTKAAKEARKALKLVDLKAGPAKRKIAEADGRSLLKRARKAEKQGRARKTVLTAIDARRKQL